MARLGQFVLVASNIPIPTGESAQLTSSMPAIRLADPHAVVSTLVGSSSSVGVTTLHWDSMSLTTTTSLMVKAELGAPISPMTGSLLGIFAAA